MRHARVLARCLVIFVSTFLPTTAVAQLVVARGPGSSSVVREISATDDRTVQAYDPAFLGGVSVALGDINGDGTAGHHHRRRAGRRPARPGLQRHGPARAATASSPTHAAFPGGVNVAAGDINGDGRADIITGAGPGGGPHVQVFSGVDLTRPGQLLRLRSRLSPAACAWRPATSTATGAPTSSPAPGPAAARTCSVFSGVDLERAGQLLRLRSGVSRRRQRGGGRHQRRWPRPTSSPAPGRAAART